MQTLTTYFFSLLGNIASFTSLTLAQLWMWCVKVEGEFLVNLRRTQPNLMLKRCPRVFETFRNQKQLKEMERLQRHLVPFAS